jgi:hypothetical protein
VYAPDSFLGFGYDSGLHDQPAMEKIWVSSL